MSEAYLDANGETDLYEQFLNLDVEDTDSFRLEDAYGHVAKFVKVPAEYEWCKGCKEHDAEKHCCHRYSTTIREAIKEWEQNNKITYCRDCIHKKKGYLICDKFGHNLPNLYGFCYWADRGGNCDSDYCDIGV